jgi:hypothetical protein
MMFILCCCCPTYHRRISRLSTESPKPLSHSTPTSVHRPFSLTDTKRSSSHPLVQSSPFLFVDLHSTSSETYASQMLPIDLGQRARFIMRERRLPTDLDALPQLRHDQPASQSHQRNIKLDPLSVTASLTTHDYNASQIYRVRSIEEKSHVTQVEHGLFEVVSTLPDDENPSTEHTHRAFLV